MTRSVAWMETGGSENKPCFYLTFYVKNHHYLDVYDKPIGSQLIG